jgi:hypothetical protein
MKGLLIFKPILNGIIEHATPDELGQFLILSKNVNKFCDGFESVIRYLRDPFIVNYFIYLYNFKYQTETICIKFVNISARNLLYVKKQTDKICLTAVKKDGSALEYVKYQTYEMCDEAVRQSRKNIKFIKKKKMRMKYL